MPTHRRPHLTLRHAVLAIPLSVVSRLAAVSATVMLGNFSWTSVYRPDDAFHDRLVRRRDHPGAADPYESSEPGDQRTDAPTFGSSSDPASSVFVPSATGQPAAQSPADDHAVGRDADNATDGGEPADGARVISSEGSAIPEPGSVAHDVDEVDEKAAAAWWFVTAALGGRFGDAHQQAARTAAAVATEHGFADDPTRLAQAVAVFLHPDYP